MKKTLIILICIFGLLVFFANRHYEKMLDPNDTFSADLVAEKCPVCEECSVCPVCPSGKITVERIIRDNPAIELPDNLLKFKYKGVEYTKAVLDTAKITIEAK